MNKLTQTNPGNVATNRNATPAGSGSRSNVTRTNTGVVGDNPKGQSNANSALGSAVVADKVKPSKNKVVSPVKVKKQWRMSDDGAMKA